MTNRRRYEITVLEFVTLLGLEYQDTTDTRIHNNMILKKEEMLFTYALGATTNPPHTQNFMPEFKIIHRLF
jgi:hypothetical protein